MDKLKCSKCNEIRPVTEFNKNSGIKRGYTYECMACRKTDYKKKHPKEQLPHGYKRCTKCNEKKKQENFYLKSKGSDERHPHCTLCRKIDKRAYYEANREKKLATDKIYYEANKEKKKAYDKAYNAVNYKKRNEQRKALEIKKSKTVYDENLTKKCTVCGEVKPLGDFFKLKAGLYGRRPACKKCSKTAKNAYQQANPEAIKVYSKAYHEANKEAILAKRMAIRHEPCKSKAWFSELLPVDKPKWNENDEITVTCYLCKTRFTPTYLQVFSRVYGGDIKSSRPSQSNFYCSDNCKDACPVYRHNPNDPDPRVGPDKSESIKARACQTDILKQQQCEEYGYNFCERCGDIIDVELHHTLPISQYGTEAINAASHLILCIGCHKELHKNC